MRLCQYRACRAPLPPVPADKRGPKPKYCTDGKTWPPDGKSCKEMAQAERDAAAAVGLEAPLATYQQATERLNPSLVEVRDRLDTLITAGANLDKAALVRVAAAEEERREALTRAEAAETQSGVDQRKRADAEKQAKLDREAKLVAERLARDAEREKTEQVNAAWAKVVEAERAQGKAEGERDEAKNNLTAYIKRYEDLADRHEALRKANTATERELTKANAELKAAKKDVETLTGEKDTLTGQVETLRSEAKQAATDHQAAIEALRKEMQDRIDALTAQVGTERDRADEAVNRLETVRQQVDVERSRADTAEAQLEGLREQLGQLREQNVELTKQLGAVEPEMADLRRQITEATKTRQALREQIDTLTGAGKPTQTT
ncbi:hypothetical protein [Actinosynnema sp. NPDC023587]|uniref:hypothetical protein n=1 Tax=Actinosynnema sp. NPDC023587 TaxID=3154695 RepID=UPI0033C8EEDD